MNEQVMSLNYDVVSNAIARISQCTATVAELNTKFKNLLSEKNAATQNKFALLTKLEEKIAEEVQAFNGVIEAQEAIRVAVEKYAELAEEANDDSAFRR